MKTLINKPHPQSTSQTLFSTLGLPAHYNFWTDDGAQEEVVTPDLLLTLRNGVEAYEGEAAAKAFDSMLTDLGLANLRTIRDGLFALEQSSWEYRADGNHWSSSHSEDELPLANFSHSPNINLEVMLRHQHDHELTVSVLQRYLKLANAQHERPTASNWTNLSAQLSMPAPPEIS